MSLKTVTKLSSDWHEAIAAGMAGPDFEFPAPWCPVGQSGGFNILPISNAGDLYLEGRAMHHCVGTYADRVHWGDVYIFSISKGQQRFATVELRRRGVGVEIGQIRGPCNSAVPKEVVRAVTSWLSSQREFVFPQRPPWRSTADIDTDIPL